jgi:hypothetical protein
MKSVLSMALLFASVSAFAYSPDWSPRESAAIKAALERAQAETGGYCDHEDLKRRPAGFNVQVYCNRVQDFIWYFVEVKPCLDYRGQWYLWTSTPVRLPVY